MAHEPTAIRARSLPLCRVREQARAGTPTKGQLPHCGVLCLYLYRTPADGKGSTVRQGSEQHVVMGCRSPECAGTAVRDLPTACICACFCIPLQHSVFRIRICTIVCSTRHCDCEATFVFRIPYPYPYQRWESRYWVHMRYYVSVFLICLCILGRDLGSPRAICAGNARREG